MFKQNKTRSRIKMCKSDRSKKSIGSDNLSLSTSNANSNGCSAKSKCLLPTISLVTSNENYESTYNNHPQCITRAVENTAVHFGDFYGLQSNNDVEQACYNNLGEETTIKKKHKSNFTRQMVHKLERATDTEDYTRQISTYLKETIEPPNFRLNPFLSENSIPDGSRRSSSYPVWYKEPDKELIVLKSNRSN